MMFYPKKDKFMEEFVTLIQLQNIVSGFKQLNEEKARGKISKAKYVKKFCRQFRKIHNAAVILRNQKIFMTNKGTASIFKLPENKIKGMNFLNYIHPVEINKVKEDCLSRMQGEEKPEAIYPTVVVDKEMKAVQVRLQIAEISYLDEPAILGILEKTRELSKS